MTTDVFTVTTLDNRPTGEGTATPVAPPTGRPSGWYDDPHSTHDQRFFNGTEWTSHVTHFGPEPCRGCSKF